MDNNITNALCFHFSETEFVTNQRPEHNKFYFDAVIQIEWDCADEEVNSIMDNDTTIQLIGEASSRNMTWLRKIKEITQDKLDWSEEDIFINIHKVMDGVINCYVTRDKMFAPNQRFDIILENTGFVKMRYVVPYYEFETFVTVRGICQFNDEHQESLNQNDDSD